MDSWLCPHDGKAHRSTAGEAPHQVPGGEPGLWPVFLPCLSPVIELEIGSVLDPEAQIWYGYVEIFWYLSQLSEFLGSGHSVCP